MTMVSENGGPVRRPEVSSDSPLCCGKVRALVLQPATFSVANAFPLPRSEISGAPGTDEDRLSWNW
jgi:hypothetical protein